MNLSPYEIHNQTTPPEEQHQLINPNKRNKTMKSIGLMQLNASSSHQEGWVSLACLSSRQMYLQAKTVKLSTIFSFVDTYSNFSSSSLTFSLKQWYLFNTCLVFECCIKFYDMLIALKLSQYMTIGSSYITLISFNICFIQTTWVQLPTTTMYSSLAVHNDTESYFLLADETNFLPKKKAPLEVLFWSSTSPAQSTLV